MDITQKEAVSNFTRKPLFLATLPIDKKQSAFSKALACFIVNHPSPKNVYV